ncbi:MAG: hypothetical protein ABII00_15840 [Elusimicrobiota bacterium]
MKKTIFGTTLLLLGWAWAARAAAPPPIMNHDFSREIQAIRQAAGPALQAVNADAPALLEGFMAGEAAPIVAGPLAVVAVKAAPGAGIAANVSGWVNGSDLQLRFTSFGVKGWANGHEVDIRLSPSRMKGWANGQEVQLRISPRSIEGWINGADINLRTSRTSVEGYANGKQVHLRISGNSVEGFANGNDVQLRLSRNNVEGFANGNDVSLRISGNTVEGHANGNPVRINSHTYISARRLVDALILNLPAPILDAAYKSASPD